MSKLISHRYKSLSIPRIVIAFFKTVAISIFLGAQISHAADIHTSIGQAVADKSDPEFNCALAYVSGSGDHSLVAPFNSTICPKDDTAMVAYMFLPHVMEKAADILNLSYKKEIKDNFDISVASGAHVGNFEQVVGVVRSIAIWFVSMILGFQILAAGIKSLTDGHIGGKSWGNFSVTTSFCFGVIFLLPLGNHIYVGELLLAIVFLIGLGICNMGISTVLYTIGHGADQTHVLGGEGITGSILAYNDRHVRDVSDGDTRTPKEIGKLAGEMHAVRYIESNMCLKQTAKIVGVNYIKNQDHWYVWSGSSTINGLLGLVATPSYLNDGVSTSVEIQKDGNHAIIGYGINTDQTGAGASAGVGSGLCSSETISYPSLTISSDGKYKDLYSSSFEKLLDASVVSGAKLLAGASPNEHQEDKIAGKLTSLLSKVNAALLVEISSYNGTAHSVKIGGDESLDLLHNVSDYFYKRIIFDVQTGGSKSDVISQYSNRYYGLVNGYSHEIDDGVVSGDCFREYDAYKSTKRTIDSLNSGDFPDDDGFNLKCANISNASGFTMAFKANDGSYEGYIKSVSSLLKSSAVKDITPKNYSLLTKYLGNIFGAIYISRRDNENNVGSQVEQTFNKNGAKISNVAYAIINEIREHGFPRFGMQFLSLFRETESIYYQPHKAVISMMPVFNTLYSASTGYVSSSVSADGINGYTPTKLIMPAEFYDAVSSSSYANTSDIQNAIMSKIGSMDSGGNGGNSGNLGGGILGGEGLSTIEDMSTLAWEKAREVLISIMPVIAIPSSVLTAGSSGSIEGLTDGGSASSVDSRYVSQVDIKYALEDLCRGDSSFGNVSSFIEKNVCERYNRHPLTYYQDMGTQLIQSVAVMSLAYIGTAMAGTFANKKLQALYNKQKMLEEEAANASLKTAESGASDALKMAVEGKGVKVTKVMFDTMAHIAKLMSGMFIYVMMLLLLIGIIFGFVMPVLPYLIFSLAWLNYILMFLQFMAVSMMLFASLVLFSNNENAAVLSRKGLVNAFINLIFRPIACIIAFSIGWSLAYAALQAMDSVSIMIIGNFSNTMSFNGIASTSLLFAMFFVGMAQLSIIKWVFSTAMGLPNYIIRLMGGDTVEEGSKMLTRMLETKVLVAKNKIKGSLQKADAAALGDPRFQDRNVRDKMNKISNGLVSGLEFIGGFNDKPDTKPDKPDEPDKTDKPDKPDKPDKTDETEKPDKTDDVK